jgi:predicted PurR-regulated permease PerM
VQATLKSPRWQRRALITVGLVLLGLVALWFASRIPRTLTVFTIAAFIAFGVRPIVTWLERRVPRTGAILVVYAGLILTIVVLTLLVVPAVLEQIQTIAANTPGYMLGLQNWLDGLQGWISDHLGRNSLLPPGYGDLKTLFADRLSNTLNNSLASLSNILIGTFTAAFVFISALVLSSFFVFRGEHVGDSFFDLIPQRRRAGAKALAREMGDVFGAYVSGQAALCAITGLLIFAGTLVIGFKFALLLGILSGIAYAVPFIGMIFAQVVAAILAAPQGGQMVLWVSVIVFVVARVSDNLLVPKIMSDSVGVSPIAVMFATFAGGELFGLPGLLLGIPAAALFKVAWQFFRSGGFKVVDRGDGAPAEAAPEVEVDVKISRAPPLPAAPSPPAH